MLILLSLVIGLTSVACARHFRAQAAQAQGGVESKQQQLAKLLRAHEHVQASLPPDTASLKLDKAVAAAMLQAYNLRPTHKISLAQARLGAGGGGSGAAELAQSSDIVKGTQLRSAKLTLAGTYADYDLFKAYLSELQASAAIQVVGLKVQENGFDLQLRVYGEL